MKPEVPDRVSADLRKHLRSQERFYNEPNEKHVEQAREEIIDAILSGHGWKGHCVAGVIENYLNVQPGSKEYNDRLGEVAARLKCLAIYPAQALPQLSKGTEAWLRGLVEGYIRDQWVEDRAAEIASA